MAALDLSGHGSSGSRVDYDFLTWADEVVEVASAEGSDQPVVIGHSMGGVVALTAAFRHAARLAGAVIVDLPDWVLEGRVPPRLEQLPTRRHHASRESAVRRFRARPADPMRQEYIERHVAGRSVHLTADGWTWRFDHAVTTHDSFPADLWGTARCPVAIVLAERSLLASEAVDQMTDRLGGVEVVTIADAGHHIMLDQPLALLAGLEDILGGWSWRRASGAGSG
ncbi:pimeloyl-ACP methyl ester carboxylesterase [Nocardioides marinisabuli]|uniref:Pimeloyl-ACP methyl ester carboxylesterase n=1 Tax=Nocardioides marinisabuli TaxID=419476 RepID=A0A7Y9F1Q2_9ACTN|nr:pimeloyl-ACP methyl ester carboxylesterase [Nocardioides marinisabuli]